MIATRQPAILCESDLHSEMFARPLVDAGFAVRRCTLDEVPQLTRTGLFNVLILGRFYLLRKTRQQEEEILRDLNVALDEFLSCGGGVFFTLPSGGTISLNTVISRLGVRLLDAAIDEAPEHRLTHDNADGARIRYAYSTHVAAPVNAGVQGVWFPTEIGGALTTRPVLGQAARGWRNVLTASEKSALIRLVEGQGNGSLVESDPLDQQCNHIPVLAIRDTQPDAPGRLAVCGIASGFHIGSPHQFPLARQLTLEGFDGRPSGLQRLILNTIHWLAQPSMQSGSLGGSESDVDLLVPQVPRFPDEPPVKWARREFPRHRTVQRGLIGARTALSTGSGTVADYVAQARASGLDFLVFLEDFEHLTPDKLATLKDECQRLSTDTFFAVPGYTMRDVTGTHFYQFGYQIELPREDLLDPTGKFIAPHEDANSGRNRYLDSSHCSLMFGELKTRCRRGTFLHHTHQIRLFDARFVDSIALVTWENGTVVDDVRDQYRYIEDKGFRLNPMVLTFLSSPADIERALASGWRNQIIEPYRAQRDKVQFRHMAPELEWWGFIDETVTNSPRYRFDCWQYGWPHGYITSGPQVLDWAVSVTQRDSSFRGIDCEIPPTADRFRADVVGFRLRIEAASDIGLDEVKLLDGQRVIRRWKCNGQAHFEQEIDLVHHQQMHLGLEVTDTRGGSAICADYATYRLDWCEFYCADRNNPLCIGYQKDSRGLAHGYSGTLYLKYNNGLWGGNSPLNGRWWYYGDKMYPVAPDPMHDQTLPMDGGVQFPGPGLHLMPDLAAARVPEHVLVIEPLQEMISTDVAICGARVTHGTDRSWPWFFGRERTGWSMFPVTASRYVDLRRRAVVFRPVPGLLTTTIYQHDLNLKARPEMPGPLPVGWLDESPDHVLHRLDGSTLKFPGVSSDDNFQAIWKQGEAIVSCIGDRQPAAFINDGVDLLLHRDPAQWGRITLSLQPQHRPDAQRAVTMRIIGIGGTHAHRRDSLWQQVRDAMGFAGRPRYRAQVHQGDLRSQRLVLEIEAAGQGAAMTLPRADLPMAVPVVVSGLNENWPVFLVDQAQARWRPLGVLEQRAYATLDTNAGDWNVFIGHPVTADESRLMLSLTQIAADQWMLEIHNPTDRAITSRVSRSRWFELIDWAGADVSLPAGASVSWTLQSAGQLRAATI